MANLSMGTIIEDEEVSTPAEKSPSGDLREAVMNIKKKKRQSAVESDDDGNDTDLESEGEKTGYDSWGKTTYLDACRMLKIVPASYFLRHMEDPDLKLGHHGLGINGAKALAFPLQNNFNVTNLELQDNWLEGEGGVYIAGMLKENCYITNLDISDNKLGRKGCNAMWKMLHVNTTLKSLNMSGNDLNDKDIEGLVVALSENNMLQSLNLSHNNFGEQLGHMFGNAFTDNDSVEILDLSWNNFRLKSGLELCQGLATSMRLKEVNLSMNGLGNEGAFGVAEIITLSPSIAHLDVTFNRIGVPGAQVIGKALEINEVLKVLKIGNNPIGLEGLKMIFIGICTDKSALTDLDFAGTEIDKEFRAMKEELLEKRNVNIKHGKVLSDYVIVAKPKKKLKLFDTPMEEITQSNIMVVIKAYCDVNGIALFEGLSSFDKNKEKKVSWSEFLTAFKENGVELSSEEIDALGGLIVEYKTSDDKIDYSALR